MPAGSAALRSTSIACSATSPGVAPLELGLQLRLPAVFPLDALFDLLDPLVKLIPLGPLGGRGLLEQLGLFEKNADRLIAAGELGVQLLDLANRRRPARRERRWARLGGLGLGLEPTASSRARSSASRRAISSRRSATVSSVVSVHRPAIACMVSSVQYGLRLSLGPRRSGHACATVSFFDHGRRTVARRSGSVMGRGSHRRGRGCRAGRACFPRRSWRSRRIGSRRECARGTIGRPPPAPAFSIGSMTSANGAASAEAGPRLCLERAGADSPSPRRRARAGEPRVSASSSSKRIETPAAGLRRSACPTSSRPRATAAASARSIPALAATIARRLRAIEQRVHARSAGAIPTRSTLPPRGVCRAKRETPEFRRGRRARNAGHPRWPGAGRLSWRGNAWHIGGMGLRART